LRGSAGHDGEKASLNAEGTSPEEARRLLDRMKLISKLIKEGADTFLR